MSSFFKKGKKNLTVADIGAPKNFRHLRHVSSRDSNNSVDAHLCRCDFTAEREARNKLTEERNKFMEENNRLLQDLHDLQDQNKIMAKELEGHNQRQINYMQCRLQAGTVDYPSAVVDQVKGIPASARQPPLPPPPPPTHDSDSPTPSESSGTFLDNIRRGKENLKKVETVEGRPIPKDDDVGALARALASRCQIYMNSVDEDDSYIDDKEVTVIDDWDD